MFNSILIIGAILVLKCEAMYTTNDKVIQADAKTFKKHVLNTQHAVICEFYAPWCGHCKSLAPEFKAAAKKLYGIAKVVAVDCDQEINKPLCAKYDIKGFPTLKLFPGGPKGAPSDYQGERKTKEIVEAVTAVITSKYVHRIGGSGKKDRKLAEFLQDGLPKIILVTDKASTPAIFKANSVSFLNRAIFGEVRSSKKDIVAELNVKEYPAVIAYPAGMDQSPVHFEGKLTRETLKEFINTYALPVAIKEKKDKSGKKEKKAKKQKNEGSHAEL